MLLLGKKERWNELKPVNYTIFCKLINTLFGPPCLIHLPIISHLKDQIFLGPFLPSTESTIHSHIFSHAISDGPGTPEHWISLCFRVTVNKLTAGQKADFLPFPALTLCSHSLRTRLPLKHYTFRNFQSTKC